MAVRPLKSKPVSSPSSPLEYAEAPWVVWSTRKRVGDPRRRAVPYRTTYYRQKLGESEALQVFEMTGTYARRVVAVLDGGTVVLSYGTALVWAFADDATKEDRPQIEGHRVAILAGYPDGILVQPYRLNESRWVEVPWLQREDLREN